MKKAAHASYGVCQVVPTTSELASEHFHHLNDVRYVDDCSSSERVVSYSSVEVFMALSLL